jgi:DNA-binding FrmR family transcriptional regulator
MVDLSAYIDGVEEEAEPDEVAEDFAALRDSLQALADAIASTNLAVINATQGDKAAATSRVQASVAALKRFHDAFAVLKATPEPDQGGGAADEDGED